MVGGVGLWFVGWLVVVVVCCGVCVGVVVARFSNFTVLAARPPVHK